MLGISFNHDPRGTARTTRSILCYLFVYASFVSAAMSAPLPWPKEHHKFDAKDFSLKPGFKLPNGIEQRQRYYEPAVAEWDLNGDGKRELILSYAHTPGQSKTCYYIFQKQEPGYRLIGRIYHCRLIVLGPSNGFAQLEGAAPSSEGVYVRALYQMCNDGSYKNTRMDVYKATQFKNDGAPLFASKVFDYTNYPNRCD